MSKKNDTILTAGDEIRNNAERQGAAAEAAPVEQAETGALVSRAEEESGAARTADGCRVYCGPSVRNVARQYTVYAGKIPEELREFISKHPAAGGLLVPVEKFAETRRRLETKGTAEAVLYNKVKTEM